MQYSTKVSNVGMFPAVQLECVLPTQLNICIHQHHRGGSLPPLKSIVRSFLLPEENFYLTDHSAPLCKESKAKLWLKCSYIQADYYYRLCVFLSLCDRLDIQCPILKVIVAGVL